jgi:hypothetical protein
MATTDAPEKKRSTLRRVLLLAAGLLVVGVATLVVFLPKLIPAETLRAEVEAALSEEMERPVRLESVRLSWVEGLVCTGLEVGAKPAKGADASAAPEPSGAGPEADADPALLARAERLVVAMRFLDAVAAARGKEVSLDTLHLDGLELWLVRGADGEWNVADLAEGGGEAKVRSLRIADARVHVLNRPAGRRLVVEDIQASVGELAATGQGYVSLSAALPGEAPGTFSLTATLSSLEPADPDEASGTVRTEWKAVDWPSVASAAVELPPEAASLGRTSGHATVTFDRGAWQADGSVETESVPLPGAAEGETISLPRAVVGFQASQAGPDKPLEVALAKLSAPGLDLKLDGSIDLSDPARPRPDLNLRGAVAWGPFSQGLEPVRALVERFERFGGRADLEMGVTSGPEGYRLRGTVDLKATEAVLPGVLRKEAGQTMRLELRAAASPDSSRAEIERLRLVAGAATVTAHGRFPLGKTDAAALAEASGGLDVEIERVEKLAETLPALAEAVGEADLAGPVRAKLKVSPRPPEGTDAAPAWDARLRVDLAELSLAAPGGRTKPAGTESNLEAAVVVGEGGRRAELEGFHFHLADAVVDWRGTATLRRPEDEDGGWSGRTKGRLRIDGMETLGALAAPAKFAAGAAPPVAGTVVLDVDTHLEENRLRGSLEVDLTEAAVAAGEAFVKPAGEAARLRAEGAWLLAKPSFVDAAATLRMPGLVAETTAKGQILIAALTGGPRAETGARTPSGDAPGRAVIVQSGRLATFTVEATIEDVARLAALSPALAPRVTGRAEGGGTVTLEVSTEPERLRVTAEADLAKTRLDFDSKLVKPAGRPLELAASADVTPRGTPAGEAAVACRIQADARLEDSRAGVAGHLLLALPPEPSALASPDVAAALVRGIDLEAEATCRHGPDLAATVPALGPVYERVGLDGPMTVRGRIAGTPLEADFGVEVEAADCRIRDGERLIKDAGTPASVKAAGRFGQVPGEMVLESLSLVLAEVKVEAGGRFLFDNPRPVPPKAPQAWSLHARGSLPDLAVLNAGLPPDVRVEKPTGSVAFDVRAAGDALGAALERCDLTFREAGLVWLGTPVRIDGRVVHDKGVLRLGDPEGGGRLRLVAGATDVSLSGTVAEPDRAPRGRVAIRGPSVDVDELTLLAERTEKEFASASKTGPKAKPDEPDAEMIDERTKRLLLRSGVEFDARLDQVAVTMPQFDDAFYELEGVEAEGRLADGRLTVARFDYGVNNGTVTSDMEIDFRPDVPVLTVTEIRRDLEPRKNVIPIISRTFPGLECTGSVSTRETKRQRLEDGAWPEGHGETVLVEGRLVGPGAPPHIQRIFPGLKLTTYNYKKMVNRYKMEEDGTVENRMIFDGNQYDIYIFGYSERDGRFRYELGVEMGLGLNSETWTRDLDQGKVPLMIYWGRMDTEEARYAEQNIRYVRPDELLHDVLVKRSLLLKLFQRMGKKPPDIPEPPDWPEEEDEEEE